jgi:hypothetical protein
LPANDGFEDREGHQAPFTLPEQENGQRPTPNAQRSTGTDSCNGAWEYIAALRPLPHLRSLFDCFDDGVEIRPVAGVEFGVEEFAIDANFERAAARRNERERRDALAEFKNFGRQTDGLRRVVSNDAVFDRYLSFHFELLSATKRTEASIDGQASRRDRKADRAVPLAILAQRAFVEP